MRVKTAPLGPCALVVLVIIAPSAYCQSYSPIQSPESVVGRTVYCRDINTNQPVPYCTLLVSTQSYSNTNGHLHNTNRPKSGVSTSPSGPFVYAGIISVQTGPTGSAAVYIKATAVGQAEKVTACAAVCDNLDYAVGYNDIYWVEEKPQWIHVGGGTTNHGGNEYNHWMTSNAAYGIYNTAVSYLASHPLQGRIAVNDMALPFGGVFDIQQTWAPPHSTHSRGTAVDVRGNGALYSLPSSDQSLFASLCRDNGAVEYLVESVGTSNQHVHCRWAN